MKSLIKILPPLLFCVVIAGAPSQQQSPDAATQQAFLKVIQEEGIEKSRQAFAETRRSDPRSAIFSEAALNTLGYKFLYERNHPAEAVAIFQLNVEAYPDSANVYDSLAEAYLAL